jgi:aryl-alcohol dehydrogenase-like predicted oxidoreductase
LKRGNRATSNAWGNIMEYRKLGRSGLKVSVFAFGAMTFGSTDGMFRRVGQTHGKEAGRLLDICLDAGVNLIDTADMYHSGQSEEVLAEALGKRRANVLIATKFYGRTGDGPNDMGGSRHHILEACEGSLRRLKTDHIDLYQIHNQDLSTPAEETLRAMDDLVRQGKVRYIGSSNHAGWTKMKSLAASDRLGLERYVSQQIQYSLLRRDAEYELLPLGVSEGVGALIWSPLASGYLTGKFKSGEAGGTTRLSGEQLAAVDDARARRIVGALEAIVADRPGITLGQAALNWVARKPGVTSILIGARTEAQLQDNLAAAGWSLTDAEIARLDDASDTALPYPYSHHRLFGGGTQPPTPLQPPIAPA